MAELLRVAGLRAGYGEAIVLDGIDLALDEGQSLAVLGRNGTGKTTLLASLVGVTRYRAGTIELGGRPLTSLRPDQRAAAGLGWVPQERNIWKSLTVEENLTAVARPGAWTPVRVFDLFPRLGERKANLGTQLSGGEHRHADPVRRHGGHHRSFDVAAACFRDEPRALLLRARRRRVDVEEEGSRTHGGGRARGRVAGRIRRDGADDEIGARHCVGRGRRDAHAVALRALAHLARGTDVESGDRSALRRQRPAEDAADFAVTDERDVHGCRLQWVAPTAR